MHVEELIIDGFKSYASRTHIKGWDPEFNAITGLNGSGKSNVLDAFCFVLGIKNYKLLRSNNIIDLIYKKGQAGITKASVTVVFNNIDKKNSPPGYETYHQINLTRQIMIGGKSKYMINGHNAQEQAVANMLQAVQLNINNPHFLIMQGKITQVLNMQPKEILSMIEEAAGTRMFEERKDKAIKTIAKKEKKIEEIQVILKEEITPKFDKLRAEKQGFLEYQKLSTESDRLQRLVSAYEYTKTEEKIMANQNITESNSINLRNYCERLEELNNETSNISKSKDEITLKIKKDISKNNELHQKQLEMDDLSKQMVKIKTKLDISEKSLTEEKNLGLELLNSIKNAEKSFVEYESKYNMCQSKYEEKKSELDSQLLQMKQLSQLVQSLTTGVTTEENLDGGFLQQLQEAKDSFANAKIIIDQNIIKVKMLSSEKSEISSKMKAAHKEIQTLLDKKSALKLKIETLTKKRDSLDYNQKAVQELSSLAQSKLAEIESIQNEDRRISSALSSVKLNYTDPEPGFDRNKVKGSIAQLIKLDEKAIHASQALEVCAGGRLYNVVVDTDSTGAKLLDKGMLKKRVTIIPLNKIRPYKASENVIKTAKSLAPGKTDIALSFVGYDKDVEAAMAFVFGNTLICQDANTAKTVTFHNSVRLKSVTLDGDVYDPSGTLQGGSKPSNSGILEQLSLLNNTRIKLDQALATYNGYKSKIDSLASTKNSFNQLSTQIDLSQHELGLVEEQFKSSVYTKLEKRVQELDLELKVCNDAISEAKKVESESKMMITNIQKDMKDFSTDKDGKLNEMKTKLNEQQKTVSILQKETKKLQKVAQASELEKDEQLSELSQLKEQMKNNSEVVGQLEESIISNEKTLVEIKSKYDIQSVLLGNTQLKMKGYTNELHELDELYKQKTDEATNLNLQIQQLKREVSRIESETQNLIAFRKKLVGNENNSWIPELKHLFGQPGGAFDFVKQDPVLAKKNLSTLKERLSQLVKTTNLTVQSNIEAVETRESSLKNMLKTVIRDRKKIQDTINSLDEYKLEALDRTWKVVNKDFGEIFSELLPGNTARLEPLDGMLLTEGLQVRVNLGGVWKNSLTELSGGQRSLIALSLILSLLQFKPAPMYILDEIDAALDLSHTQNIGRLFKSRFKGSQFIVVSLKEGMFNNANVLFRVRFRNGVSNVERN
ncbi:hypothetical protein BB559_000229 [Furculomyces boomerangus]|uniref:Structural maintenance of chromosomes protein n=1 Tax=Furculomyces boomerangus TaxID=61424 RepID=A0A2T9Z618_9FUNG|nr:hypothetical protein BB559_000229 [Furculomyces boomerangus]